MYKLGLRNGFVAGVWATCLLCLTAVYIREEFNYILNKSEYNELRQDGKVWAYVRKDGKL